MCSGSLTGRSVSSPTLEGVTRERDRDADGETLTYDASPGVGLASFDGQSGLLHTFSRYCSRFGAEPAVSLEVPYVGTETDPVTPETARGLGRDLSVALVTWLSETHEVE